MVASGGGCAAVVGMTETAAKGLAPAPEVVAQPMGQSVPMRRYGGIDEIPGTVAFLMSDDSSYIAGGPIVTRRYLDPSTVRRFVQP
ncbi:MAG: SDR family oxidoreductase [Spirochaetota bacterium]